MLLVETQLPVGIANKMGCTLFQQEMVDASAVQERLKPGFVADDLGIQNVTKSKHNWSGTTWPRTKETPRHFCCSKYRNNAGIG